MAIILDFLIGNESGGKSGEKDFEEFTRSIRNRLMWTILEWSLGDPNRLYKKIELSQLNAYILFVVKEAGSISIGEVAKKLRQEKSVLTKSLTKLIERGYIRKERDKTDGRRLLLSLTDDGRKVFFELDSVSIENYSKWLRHVPTEDRKKVLDAIIILDDAMTLRRIERNGSENGNGK